MKLYEVLKQKLTRSPAFCHANVMALYTVKLGSCSDTLVRTEISQQLLDGFHFQNS